MPNNPPANPIPGAIYVDQSTNLSWVWTGTYWLQASGSGNYNSQVGTGATIIPGYFAEPSPDSWVPHVGATAPSYPSCGQIWIDTSVTPNSSYVWDCNTNAHILLAGGDPSASSAVVSTVAPTTRTNGNPLEVGDLWIDANTQVISYWNGSAWLPASSPDTNSIPSAITPTTRADGSALQAGDIWADINSNLLYFYNGSSFATIVAQSDDHQLTTPAPTTSPSGAVLSDGDRWTDSSTGNHYYYEAGSWVPYNDTHSQVSTAAPTTRATGDALRNGDQWFDSNLNLLYVWEIATASWTRIGSDTHSFVQNGQPTLTVRPSGDTLLTGDQYIDSATHKLWYWTGTAWEVASKDSHSFTGNGIPALATRPDGTALVAGDQYLDLVGNDLYGYNGSGWVPFISPNTHAFTGSGAPTLTLRPDASPLLAGDEYIDITTDIGYYWNGTAWEILSRDLHSFTGLVAPTIIQRPDGNPLIEGDQYINKTTNDSYFWDSAAWVLIGGDTHSIRATTAPTTRIDGTPLRDGDQWVDTDNQNAFYVYNIGTAAWEILGDDSHSFAGAGAPTLTVRPNGQALQAGDQWLNTTTKYLYGWDGAAWSIIGVDTHSFSGAADPALTTRPDGTTLLTGDQYLNATTKILFGWDGAAWNVISGDTHSILGAGDPTTTNPTITRPSGSPLKDGDLYVDTSAQESYYYTAGTATWTKYTTPDTHSFTGAGEPVAANPVTTRPDGSPLVQGDMYVDTATKFTYGYLSGAWAQLGSSDTHSFSGNGTPFIAAPTVGTNSITVRPDNGLPLTDGDQYFDKDTNILYLYTGAEWIAGADDTHSFHQGALGTLWPTITTRPDGTPLRNGDLATADDNRLFSYNPVYSGFREVIGTYYHSIMSTWLDPNGNITDRQDGAVTGLYNGDMYIDEQSKRIWFRDGANWKEIERDGHSFTASGAPTLIKRPADAYAYEAALETGDQYINTDDGQLYYWNGSSWQKSGLPDTHSFTGGANPTLTVRPDGSALLTGDQFINTATDGLWYWNGTAWEIVSNDTHSFVSLGYPAAVAPFSAGNRPDGSPLQNGDLAFNDSSTLKPLYAYDGGAWKHISDFINSQIGAGDPTSTNPISTRPNAESLQNGDLYVDTTSDLLYVRNAGNWELVSLNTHSFTGTVDPDVAGSLVDSGNRPDGSALVSGDQYINTNTNVLFSHNGTSWEVLNNDRHSFAASGTPYISTPSVGTNSITTRPNGTSLLTGDQYVDTATDFLYYYNGAEWEQLSSIDTHSFTGTGAPTLTQRPDGSSLITGDQYVDLSTRVLYTRDGGSWVVTSDDTHSIYGSGDPITTNPTTTRPNGAAVQQGDLYVDGDNGTLWVRTLSSWALISDYIITILGTGAPTNTVRPNGLALQNGDLYIDTSSKTWYYYSAGAWVAMPSVDTHSFFGGGNPNGVLTTRPDGTALLTGDTYTDTDELPSIVQYVYHTASAAWFLVDEYHTYTGGGHPTLSSFAAGGSRKMYTNTSTKEVYFWSGTAWLLIGPTVHTSDDLATNGFPTVRPNGVDNPLAGDIFTDSVTGRGFYYNGTSYVPYGHYNFVQSTTPAAALTYERDTWVDTNTLQQYVYYNDGSTVQWTQIN